MVYLAATVGVIAVVQGVAWLGAVVQGRRRRAQGAVLAALGMALVVGSLLHATVPNFFD